MSTGPTLTLPPSEQVTASGTAAISGISYNDSFAAADPGAMYLRISDLAGALSAKDRLGNFVAGSGSNSIALNVDYADVTAVLSSLSYAAAATTGSDTISFDLWDQAGVETTGTIPVTIGHTGTGGSGGGPALTEPTSETVAASGTLAVSGSYSDSFAAANAGAMFISISDSSGTLRATDATGHAVSGSGTGNITLTASYADVNAVLKSLSYSAGATAGSDNIHFDIWNQAGVETTDTIPVTINAGGTGGGATETWTGALNSDWNNAGNWSGGAVPVSGDNVIIGGGTPNNATLSNATLTGETITLGNTATVAFTNVVLDSVLQTASNGRLQIGGTLTIGSHGTLGPEPSGTLAVTSGNQAAAIVNNGVIHSATGATLGIANSGTTAGTSGSLANNGIIAAGGGFIGIDFVPSPFAPPVQPEDLINSGRIVLSNGGNLQLGGTFIGGDVTFNGTGALSLSQTDAFAGGAAVAGFGKSDQIDLYGTTRSGNLTFGNDTLTVNGSGGPLETIPFSGSYQLGNFTTELIGGTGNPQIIAYAPDGGPSGIVQPDIIAPAAASVSQGTTLSLGQVSINALGATSSGSVFVDADSGTLYMNGASGSGTSHLSLSSMMADQINADLASLAYVPAATSSSDIVTITAVPPAPVESLRSIPISITGGSTGPILSEPSTESVSPNGTVAVSGSYSDSFAQSNPGLLFLGISDATGTLSATDVSGHSVAGSGSSSIGLSTDYVDLNAILASLHYTAGAGTGSDNIHFDLWNQAGVETIGNTSVTIDSPSLNTAASLNIMSDFASIQSVGTTAPAGTSGVGGSTAPNNLTDQPILVMPTLGV
jgi:hypothetical protein